MTSARRPAKRSRSRIIVRSVIAGALVLIVVFVIVAAVFVSRLSKQPEWWTPELAGDGHAAQLAEEAEKGMTRVLSKERDAGRSWTVELTQEQANAWLATRLERWAQSQHADWPAMVRGVRVAFEDQRVTIGVALDAAGSTRFASITLTPAPITGDNLRLHLTHARVGVQGVPISALRALMRDLLPDDALPSGVDRAIREGVIEAPARYTLDDGRQLRLSAIHAEPGGGGRLLLTFESDAR